MNIKLTLLTISLLLVSCGQSSEVGADGYSFGKPQYKINPVVISYVLFSSRASFNAELKRRGTKQNDNSTIMAFSELKPPLYKTCTIYMMDPRVEYKPEFIGHETLHCFYGQWHTNNEQRK